MDIKNTQSEENLKAALAGESMARNKYTYYAMTARDQGFPEIADEFERLALNEMRHAKIWFTHLNGKRDSTVENLKEAASGEFGEWHSMYPGFAQKAREEGLEELAQKFEGVAAIERDHEMQFMRLYAQLLSQQTPATAPSGAPAAPPKEVPAPKAELVEGYRCIFCGAVFETRPDVCNVCQAIGSFENCRFEKQSNN